MPVITLVDVLQVQPFIFATNRLADVVAGSHLVAKATTEGFLEEHQHGVSVVNAAGGNAVLEFSSLDQAREWAAVYSRALIERFPGLDAAVVHHEIGAEDPDETWLDAFKIAQRKLALHKLALPADSPTLGLSVTAECIETRGIATRRDRRSNEAVEVPISETVARRRALQKRAHNDDERWLDRLPTREKHGWTLTLTRQTDELGRSAGELSLVGVVHIDGNGIGSAVAGALDAAAEGGDEAVKQRLQTISREVQDAVDCALRAIFDAIVERLEPRRNANGELEPWIWVPSSERGFKLLRDQNGRVVLPIRPVVAAGDELTFVCDGRIALSAVRIALERLRARSSGEEAMGVPIGACAGVALIKAHAPFSRGYELAEKLCREAKRQVLESGESPGYALDWHVGYATPLETVDSIRERQFTYDTRRLTMRPYALGDANPYSFTWLDDRAVTNGLLAGQWRSRRNKVKQLRRLAREGPGAVAQALNAWSVTAGIDALPGGATRDGFHGDRTWLLDAAELMDIHLPLQ